MDSEKDHSLDTLLDLNGEIFPMNNGHWVKFKAKQIPANPAIPHGIRYSLTLHDRYNVRVLGFDNAHAVKSKTRNIYTGRKVAWHHLHRMNIVDPYSIQSAGQLLEDFWKAVDEYLGE